MEAGAEEMEASAADATDRPTASKATGREHFHYMVLGTSRPSQHPRSNRHGTSSARHGEARMFDETPRSALVRLQQRRALCSRRSSQSSG